MKKQFLGVLFSLACVSTAYAQPDNSVTVFAASSLTNVMQQLASEYQKETGVTVRVSLASSSTLARQIVQGAPADIYISADDRWMNYAQQQGALDNASRKTLLTNQLVVVAPITYPKNAITVNSQWSLKTALEGTRLAMGDPAYVPAGIYAKQSLEKLRLWSQAQSQLAPSNNVRSALMLVENGEAKLGIVYKTDALIAKNVKIVATLPNDSHLPITYPMAMVKQANNTSVQGFYRYLQSPQAKKVFQQYGFGVA